MNFRFKMLNLLLYISEILPKSLDYMYVMDSAIGTISVTNSYGVLDFFREKCSVFSAKDL
jgi:hypothetical protein